MSDDDPSRKRSSGFYDRILRSQTPKERQVNELMSRVLGKYIVTEHDESLENELKWLNNRLVLEKGKQPNAAKFEGPVRAGCALLVVGNAGSGKSRLVNRAFRTMDAFEGFGVEGMWSPVVSVFAPSPFALGELGNRVARHLGYRGKRDIKHTKVWPFVRELMFEREIHILHIDEAQHGDEILGDTNSQQVENTLKGLMQDEVWPIWLVMSGTPTLARFCQKDESMKRRVRVLRLNSLPFPEFAEAARKAIGSIAEECPDLVYDHLLTDGFASRLLHAATYEFGIMVEFIQDAIGECLFGDRRWLSVDNFADVYSARTGELSDDRNPFLAPDWTLIDVGMALFEEQVDARGKPTGQRIPKDRRARGAAR